MEWVRGWGLALQNKYAKVKKRYLYLESKL